MTKNNWKIFAIRHKVHIDCKLYCHDLHKVMNWYAGEPYKP